MQEVESEINDIKFEDEDSTLCENIAGSNDLIEIVKHEINVDDQDNTSHHNEDIDSRCAGFTDEEIAAFMEYISQYACGAPTGDC